MILLYHFHFVLFHVITTRLIAAGAFHMQLQCAHRSAVEDPDFLAQQAGTPGATGLEPDPFVDFEPLPLAAVVLDVAGGLVCLSWL